MKIGLVKRLPTLLTILFEPVEFNVGKPWLVRLSKNAVLSALLELDIPKLNVSFCVSPALLMAGPAEIVGANVGVSADIYTTSFDADFIVFPPLDKSYRT